MASWSSYVVVSLLLYSVQKIEEIIIVWCIIKHVLASMAKGSVRLLSSFHSRDVTYGINASHLTAIVTGSSRGIGAETARVLALRGVRVIIAVRNVDSGMKVKEEILEQIPNAKINVMELDLSSLASVGKFASNFNSLDLPLNILVYNSVYSYGVSKLANILHAKELAKRFKEEEVNITINSVHPGLVATNILSHRIPQFINNIGQSLSGWLLKNAGQGAATQCYVAMNPKVEGVSGEYFSNSNIAKPNAFGCNAELAKKLWDFSLNLTDPK